MYTHCAGEQLNPHTHLHCDYIRLHCIVLRIHILYSCRLVTVFSIIAHQCAHKLDVLPKQLQLVQGGHEIFDTILPFLDNSQWFLWLPSFFSSIPEKNGAAMVVDPVQSTDRRLQDGLAMATSCALVAADSHTSASGLAVFLFVLGGAWEGMTSWTRLSRVSWPYYTRVAPSGRFKISVQMPDSR